MLLPDADAPGGNALGRSSLAFRSSAAHSGADPPFVAPATPSLLQFQSGSTLSFQSTDTPTRRTKFADVARSIINHRCYLLLMTSLTFYVLIGDDIRRGIANRPLDPMFNVLTVLCLLLFSIEIIALSALQADYIFTFWFVMDILTSASLIFDLTFVSEYFADDQSISAKLSVEGGSSSGSGYFNNAEYARASRSGRLGTRIVRILRIIRVMDLGRTLRSLSFAMGGPMRRSFGEAPGTGRHNAESNVGRKLVDITTKRVIALVLVMLITTPYLDVGVEDRLFPVSAQYGADTLLQLWQEYELRVHANSTSSDCCDDYRLNWERELLYFIFDHIDVESGSCPSSNYCYRGFLHRLCWIGHVKNSRVAADSLNSVEEAYVHQRIFDEPDESGVQIAVVRSLPAKLKTALSKPWTTDCSESDWLVRGVSLVDGVDCPTKQYRMTETMSFFSQFASRQNPHGYMKTQFVFVFDVQREIFWRSILGMIEVFFVIVAVAAGSYFFSKDVDNMILDPIERMIQKVKVIRKNPLQGVQLADSSAVRHSRSQRTKETMETRILEVTIIKLSSLLALCFGEAGSEIVGANLEEDDAIVNAIIPGNRVEAIFGVCMMHDFVTLTEVLKEYSFIFINRICEIVHCTVDKHLGSVAEQPGTRPQFLLVWRIQSIPEGMHPRIFDLAVMSAVQVAVDVKRDMQLKVQCEHPMLRSTLEDSSVRLGFGLHFGWAIVGAIGSEMKIDVSYVSSDVRLAGMAALSTTTYGVKMLVSQAVVERCSEGMHVYFRPVDRVRFARITDPIRLYTIDIDDTNVSCETTIEANWQKGRRLKGRRQEQEQIKRRKLWGQQDVYELFETDRHLRKMRQFYTPEFFELFLKGYLNYEAGEFKLAAKIFKLTRFMLQDGDSEDGPSRALLEFIKGCDMTAPKDWRGFHDLSSFHVRKPRPKRFGKDASLKPRRGTPLERILPGSSEADAAENSEDDTQVVFADPCYI